MDLGQILNRVHELADDECIFARKPWSSTSEAVTSLLAEDYRMPSHVSDQGLDYFLEIHVAKEVLGSIGGRSVSEEEKVNLLVFYAENDAYPDWVFAL